MNIVVMRQSTSQLAVATGKTKRLRYYQTSLATRQSLRVINRKVCTTARTGCTSLDMDNYETPLMVFRNKKASDEIRDKDPKWMEADING